MTWRTGKIYPSLLENYAKIIMKMNPFMSTKLKNNQYDACKMGGR